MGLCNQVTEVTVRFPVIHSDTRSKDLLNWFSKCLETNAELNLSADCPQCDYFHLEITVP